MKQFAAKGSTRICEILVLKKKKKKNGLPNGAKLLNTDVSIPVTFSRCHAQHTELNVIFSFCIFLKAKEIVFSGVNFPPALFADLFANSCTDVCFLPGWIYAKRFRNSAKIDLLLEIAMEFSDRRGTNLLCQD